MPVLFISGTIGVTMAFYWTTAFMFMLMDYTQQPFFLMKYKIQPGKNTPPNTAKVIKVLFKQKCQLKVFFFKIIASKLNDLKWLGNSYVRSCSKTIKKVLISLWFSNCTRIWHERDKVARFNCAKQITMEITTDFWLKI